MKCNAQPSLIEKIKDKTVSISIFGMGYVGQPLYLRFKSSEFDNICGIDVNTTLINRLGKNKEFKVYDATNKRANDVIYNTDICIICVPTPLKHNSPDLTYVYSVVNQLIAVFSSNEKDNKERLIILESTTYPGCTEELYTYIKSNLEMAGMDTSNIYMAFSPERENPGQDVFTLKNTPKVVGGVNEKSLRLSSELYKSICNEVVEVSSTSTSEMVKILENTYRCVNIALINELKFLCDKLNIDIHEVVNAAKTKPFGFQAFYPSAGVGGHCIPIDPLYLSWAAKREDFFTRFIDLATEINTQIPYKIVDKIKDTYIEKQMDLKNSKIRILGIAYKPEIDDDRESPAYKIWELLSSLGANVSFFDPYIEVTKNYPKIGYVTRTPLYDGIFYDAQIIVSGHKTIDYTYALLKSRIVFDTCNVIENILKRNVSNVVKV